jgi:hypothetical protein
MQYHPEIIKSETLLSCWIFYWAVIYCIAKYFAPQSSLNELLETYANPTFAIMFALSYQTYAFIKIILNARPRPFNRFSRILTKFFILTFTFKLLPLYLVVGTPPLNEFINKIYKQSLNGISSFFIVFLSYFIYITKHNLDIFEIYADLEESYIKDDNRLIVYRWVKSTFNI